MIRNAVLGLTITLVLFVVGRAGAAEPYFQIQVVDDETGRGVPLVELRIVNNIRYVTDSNGYVAFQEPGLMDQRVYFSVSSHGYEFPKDGFGYQGRAIDIKPGGSATLKIRRVNLAERLYRVTGGGIYHDSVLLGRQQQVPTKAPVLAGQVLGSDSVMNAVYGDRIYWFWGDTNRPSYPLGNFHTPGATSELPASGGLDPARGVDLRYFVDADGFAKPTARMPGDGPTWISGLVVIDDNGRQRMFAGYAKIKPPMTVYERGLIEWNDEQQQFDQVVVFPSDAPLHPDGHTYLATDNGVEYVYFCTPYPLTRVRATAEALRDPSQYEAYTCLQAGEKLTRPEMDRDDAGHVRYSWKANTPAVGSQDQKKLVRAGSLKSGESLLRLRDRDTGKSVTAHAGSVYWNPHRGRWVMIATEVYGTSLLGEVWFAESSTPLGPWAFAVKIVSHNDYSFYNPKQHPMFDQHGGRVIYFEGTYTHTFSGNKDPTPRYDYNQIMYRLDLGDPRTTLPVPFSCEGGIPDRISATKFDDGAVDWNRIAWFACDRPAINTKPVYLANGSDRRPQLRIGDPPNPDSSPLFHALQPDMDSPPNTTVPLWEFVNSASGDRIYSTDEALKRGDYQRAEQPVCLVWRTLDGP